MTSWSTVLAELPKRWAHTVTDLDAVPIEDRREMADRSVESFVDVDIDDAITAWCHGFAASDRLQHVHKSMRGGLLA